jgi:hypothetical protein
MLILLSFVLTGLAISQVDFVQVSVVYLKNYSLLAVGQN